MALALELGLDAAADREVRALWATLEQMGVPTQATHLPGLRPHVTLAVTDDAEGMRAAAASLGIGSVSVEIEVTAPGLFMAEPPILMLAVSPAPALVELQQRVSERLDAAGVVAWPHFIPGTWMPHVTLSMGVPEAALGDAVAACLELSLPLHTHAGDPGLTDSVTGATTTL
jgi:2'-5' RNA ligase